MQKFPYWLKAKAAGFAASVAHLGPLAGEGLADVEKVDPVVEGQGDQLLAQFSVILHVGIDSYRVARCL